MSKGYTIDLPDPATVAADLVRELMPELTKIVAEDAKVRAPKKSGKLANSIEDRLEDGGMKGAVAAKAPHAHLVHEGTHAHMTTTSKRALVIPTAAGVLLRRSASHPGAKKQPFLTDALEGNAAAIAEAFRTKGESILQKAIGK